MLVLLMLIIFCFFITVNSVYSQAHPTVDCEQSLILAIPAKYTRARKWASARRVSSQESIFVRARVFRRNRQN